MENIVTQINRPENWKFPVPFGIRKIVIAILVFLLLGFSAHRVELDKAMVLNFEILEFWAGKKPESQVLSGIQNVGHQIIKLQISERTPISRIENFDRNKLPLLTHIETTQEKVQTLNPETLQMDEKIETNEELVHPFGYLLRVLMKMVETLEIALWGTIIAVLMGLPLGLLGARNLSPHPIFVSISRTIVSFLRAIPELISALFLVLAYGFGPIAGIFALALHAAGFFGKFYADDIESSDPKPKEALEAIGANRLKQFRFAILPQVLPQYVAYTLYILDRNVRMATIIGLVGAGGIGQELKGRYDMYNYGHVGTILVAIFILVIILEQIANRLRKNLI